MGARAYRGRTLLRPGLILLGVLIGWAGCAQDDVVAVRRCVGTSCPISDAGFCAGSGPEISAAQDSSICGGSLLSMLLPMGLCTCGDVQGGDVQSDSFDSAMAPYAAGGLSGDVGVQGLLRSEGSWDIGGALLASSTTGVTVMSTLRTRGSLQAQGPLNGSSVLVDADAAVGGDIQLVNLRVDGTLTTPAGSALAVSGQQVINATAQKDVRVPIPCPCELDPYVTAPINQLQAHNDNALLGLTRQQFELYSGNVAIDLPCGRYYFSRIAGTGSLHLRIQGRVELAVGGGIDVGGDWTVSLSPAAELDLYVHGDVAVAGTVAVGDPMAPPRLRWFPGGIDALRFSGGGSISAALLGRRRAWMTSAPIDLYGAAVLDSAQINGSLRIHRDLAIQRIAGRCRLP